MPYHEQTHATVLAINLPGKTSQQYVTEVHHLVTFGLGDFSVRVPSSPAGDSRLEMSSLLQRQRERGLSQVAASPTPCKGHVCILAQSEKLKKTIPQFLWSLTHDARGSHRGKVLVSGNLATFEQLQQVPPFCSCQSLVLRCHVWNRREVGLMVGGHRCGRGIQQRRFWIQPMSIRSF